MKHKTIIHAILNKLAIILSILNIINLEIFISGKVNVLLSFILVCQRVKKDNTANDIFSTLKIKIFNSILRRFEKINYSIFGVHP